MAQVLRRDGRDEGAAVTPSPELRLSQRAQYVAHGIAFGIVSINPDPAHPAVRLVLRDLTGSDGPAEWQITARPGTVIDWGTRRLTLTAVVTADAAPRTDIAPGTRPGTAPDTDRVRDPAPTARSATSRSTTTPGRRPPRETPCRPAHCRRPAARRQCSPGRLRLLGHGAEHRLLERHPRRRPDRPPASTGSSRRPATARPARATAPSRRCPGYSSRTPAATGSAW